MCACLCGDQDLKKKRKEKEKNRPSLRICANLSILKFLHCLQVRLHLRQVDRVIESARNNACNCKQGKAISYCSVSGKEDVAFHQLHSQLKLSSLLRGQRRESETGLKSNRLIITPSLKQQ